jgi:hypothetical protein
MSKGGDRVRRWLIIFGIVVVLFAGGYLALSYYGVKLMQGRLQRVTGPGLTVGEMKVNLTHLSIRGIRYEDPRTKLKLLDVEEVRIYPDILSPLKGSLSIRECSIHKPSLFFFRSREGDYTGPWIPPEETEAGKGTPAQKEQGGKKEGVSFLIQIHRFRIEKGSVDFEDRKTDGPPATIRLSEIGLDLKDIQYPMVSAHSPVELNCKMKGLTKEGEIEAAGWIDFRTLDMDIPLKVRNVEVKTFEPYYRKKVTADIVGGDIHLDMKMVIKDRKIDAPGVVSLVNLQMGREEGSVFYIPAKLLISLLKDRGNQVKARFEMRGNLDDPQFDLQESFLSRIGFSLAESLGIPIKGLGEILTGGSIKGARGLAEGMKSIGEIFRKKKEPRK